MPIITKPVYTCDNCKTESTKPRKWLKFNSVKMGQYYLSKEAIFCTSLCLKD